MVVYYRRLPHFEYFSPSTLPEALSLLARYQGRARVLAGGTDLVPKLKAREFPDMECIVDISKIPSLDFLTDDPKLGLRIGALTRLRVLETSALLARKYSPLQQAARNIGSVQVRNRGTAGGNLCNAVPSADLAPALLALAAKMVIASASGQRTVDLADFFVGPNRTALAPGEILSEILVPTPAPQARAVYLKHSPRAAMDLAVVGVAALVIREDESCREVRLALGAVAPTPMRAREAEAVLRWQVLGPKLIAEAASTAARECRPIDDHRASAAYRREMVEVLTARALTLAAAPQVREEK